MPCSLFLLFRSCLGAGSPQLGTTREVSLALSATPRCPGQWDRHCPTRGYLGLGAWRRLVWPSHPALELWGTGHSLPLWCLSVYLELVPWWKRLSPHFFLLHIRIFSDFMVQVTVMWYLCWPQSLLFLVAKVSPHSGGIT